MSEFTIGVLIALMTTTIAITLKRRPKFERIRSNNVFDIATESPKRIGTLYLESKRAVVQSVARLSQVIGERST